MIMLVMINSRASLVLETNITLSCIKSSRSKISCNLMVPNYNNCESVERITITYMYHMDNVPTVGKNSGILRT